MVVLVREVPSCRCGHFGIISVVLTFALALAIELALELELELVPGEPLRLRCGQPDVDGVRFGIAGREAGVLAEVHGGGVNNDATGLHGLDWAGLGWV